METLVIEVAKQAPALAVLVFLVFRFLKYVEARDAAMEKLNAETIAMINTNTQAVSALTESLRGMYQTIGSVVRDAVSQGCGSGKAAKGLGLVNWKQPEEDK